MFVHHDAIVNVEPGSGGQLGVGCNAHADNRHVRFEFFAAVRDDALDTAPRTDELCGCRIGAQRDALPAQERRDEGAGLGVEHQAQRRRGDFDQGRLQARLGERGRHLAADKAAAHHDRPPRLGHGGSQGIGILKGAKVVNAVQIGARYRQPARAPASGEQQLVESHLAAIVERDEARAHVHRDGRLPQELLHPVALVEARRAQEYVLALHAAQQVILRQRHAIIGQVRLGANQHQTPRFVAPADGVDSRGGGQAAADDDVRDPFHRAFLRTGVLESTGKVNRAQLPYAAD